MLRYFFDRLKLLSKNPKVLVIVSSAIVATLLCLIIHFLYLHRKEVIYLEVGSFISTISCSIILIAYLSDSRFRRHPNSLLFWKTLIDSLFTVRFWFGFAEINSNIHCGQITSAYTQFTALSSECWFFMMAIDLWLCATNPFTNIRFNIKMYHVFSWSVATSSALVVLFLPNIYSATPGGICWFTEIQQHLYGWTLYYGWVLLFVIGSLVILILESRAIPAGGMLETRKTRKDIINSGRMMSIAYCTYQVCAMFLWVIDTFSNNPSSFSSIIGSLLSLFYGSKGVIDLAAWFSINSYLLYSNQVLPNRLRSNPSSVDIDLEPQLNVALRREVLHFTTKGVIAAVSHCSKSKVSKQKIRLKIHELGISTPFNDYEPCTFYRIRKLFGLDNLTYMKSFVLTCHERMQAGGSGAFLYYTADYRFIVKSITSNERTLLLKMLPDYVNHMIKNPGSYLTRFYGCHSIFIYGKLFNFVVMGNVIGRRSMHQFYDIKGSWISRNAQPIPLGKRMICTYCSLPFKIGSWEECSESIRGRHMPHIVLKDNDFRKKLRLDSREAELLVEEIKKDASFLCAQGIMDYSLLISIHNAKYNVDEVDLIPPETESYNNSRRYQLNRLTQQEEFTIPTSNYTIESLICNDNKDEEMTLLAANDEQINTFGTFDASTSPTFSHSPTKPGLKAQVVIGADYYTFGIIDILQTWTWKKKLERFIKIHFYRQDRNGISAIEPKLYAERFKSKIEDITLMHNLDEI